jgi:hypothetical protein
MKKLSLIFAFALFATAAFSQVVLNENGDTLSVLNPGVAIGDQVSYDPETFKNVSQTLFKLGVALINMFLVYLSFFIARVRGWKPVAAPTNQALIIGFVLISGFAAKFAANGEWIKWAMANIDIPAIAMGLYAVVGKKIFGKTEKPEATEETGVKYID